MWLIVKELIFHCIITGMRHINSTNNIQAPKYLIAIVIPLIQLFYYCQNNVKFYVLAVTFPECGNNFVLIQ